MFILSFTVLYCTVLSVDLVFSCLFSWNGKWNGKDKREANVVKNCWLDHQDLITMIPITIRIMKERSISQ